MTRETELPPVLVSDANVLIDLIKLGILEAVLGGCDFDVAAVLEVIGEVQRPDLAATLSAAIDGGLLRRVCLESSEEVAESAKLSVTLDIGESATLAYAQHHGCHIATDERRGKVLREIRARIGDARLVRGPELIAQAVRAGSVDVQTVECRASLAILTATTPRARDEGAHLVRVIGRVRERLGLGEEE